MKRSPSPLQPSPSTSSSSSSIANDQPPLKQSSKKPRKKTTPDESRQKGKPSTPFPTGRSSIYRGVTRHRWTGRFEAHLWDKSSYNTTQNKKGKQVYLGAYDCEEDAARTYDLAALKYWGPETLLNFPKENYTKEVEEMQNVSKEEYLASLRRRSSGFSRGVSKYRGVAKHHHNGRWEARIGRVFGNKYLYLGTFSSQEEAAKAYDLAAIQYRGRNAVTNFDISNYIPKEESTAAAPPTSTETIPDVVDPQPNELDHKLEQEKDEAAASLESSELMINGLCGSPVMAIDGAGCDHEGQESDPWRFCLDAAGYDDLLISPHMLEENDANLLDLLDQTVFEDDILLMFDYEMKEEKTDDKSPFDSSSPSSSSTVTSELC